MKINKKGGEFWTLQNIIIAVVILVVIVILAIVIFYPQMKSIVAKIKEMI